MPLAGGKMLSVRVLLGYPLAGLGALLVLVTFTPSAARYAKLLAVRWTDPAGEVLVVPGGRHAR